MRKFAKRTKKQLTVKQLRETFPDTFKITVSTPIYNTWKEQNSELEIPENQAEMEPTVDEEIENSDDGMNEIPDVPEVVESAENTVKKDAKKQKVKA